MMDEPLTDVRLKKVSAWTPLCAAILVVIVWGALDRITGRHTDLLTSFFAAIAGGYYIFFQASETSGS